MKYILLAFLALNFTTVLASCDEWSLTSLHRMSDDDYCNEEDVVEAAYITYGTKVGYKDRVLTPDKNDVYGDNDGASLLVLEKKGRKSKYVRFKIEYGRCKILSCTDSGFYKDEI